VPAKGQLHVFGRQGSHRTAFALAMYHIWAHYGDGAGNTVDENSSVFSLIRVR